jgi:hypothetical protein
MRDEVGTGFSNSVAACCTPFCPSACRSEGIYFSVEEVLIDVFQPDDGIAPRLLRAKVPGAPKIDNLNPDADPTARFALGWMTCDGLGIQVRYWDFDNATSVPVTINPTPPTNVNFVGESWDVGVLDVEVVKNRLINPLWDTTFSGGYRFARYEERAALRLVDQPNNIADADVATLHTRYIGNGLTGAIGARRQLTPRISLMANGRASLLFGTQTVDTNVLTSLNDTFDPRYILESQVGASCEHPICGGGFWFARAGYEIQYWNDFVVPFNTQTDPSSTILHGFFLAVGLQR